MVVGQVQATAVRAVPVAVVALTTRHIRLTRELRHAVSETKAETGAAIGAQALIVQAAVAVVVVSTTVRFSGITVLMPAVRQVAALVRRV